MKHFSELSRMESALIDLSVLNSLVRVVTYGMPEANRQDAENAMHGVTDMISSVESRLSASFYELFEAIKTEGESETKGRKNKPGKDKV
jgi:hypothetical protein